VHKPLCGKLRVVTSEMSQSGAQNELHICGDVVCK
jgi:hypothetical protein